MTILDQIIIDKHGEVALKKKVIPINQLESSFLMDRPTCSLTKRLRESKTGIIAEHKRRSPSKAIINHSLSVSTVIKAYEAASVSGISVLTDTKYFGGATDDILLARALTGLPLLRKDFIIDEYQVVEARAIGADAILLIAAVLSPNEITRLAILAKSLDLEVLLEVHSLKELQNTLIDEVDMIGVNNRNLKTFEVNMDVSRTLATHIPKEYIKISESGISEILTIKELREIGYKGFLMGETFMISQNIALQAKDFIDKLR